MITLFKPEKKQKKPKKEKNDKKKANKAPKPKQKSFFKVYNEEEDSTNYKLLWYSELEYKAYRQPENLGRVMRPGRKIKKKHTFIAL